MHGGNLVVKALEAHGVERVFCVAGESYLSVLDGLLDAPDIGVVTCRQESGVTFMADAYAQLSGRCGIAMVTRGPGACNASIGVHTAKQSSTPMILFVGLIPQDHVGKEAFQEFDLPEMFGSLSKWAAVIEDAADIPGMVAKAFHVAMSGRPGPVVLGLPENILGAFEAEMPEITALPVEPRVPADGDLERLFEMLGAAERPLILAGGGGWSDQACANLERFAESSGIPVVTSFRRQDVFDHNHANYVGELGTGPNPALVEKLREADVVFVLNARLNEIAMQEYTLISEGQTLIQSYPDGSVFGKAYTPDFCFEADVNLLCAALAEKKIDGSGRVGWLGGLRAMYEDWSAIEPQEVGWSGADMTQVFRQLRDVLPDDAIITTDAGNFSGWCQRYLRYGRPGRLLAPVSGAMGFAVPSAVAASLYDADRIVCGFCGDGGFMMTAQELATAVHYKATPIMFVCNNGVYGTIKMHQDMHFPGRKSATDLSNPDFVRLAKSYGAYSAVIKHENELAGAWQAALEAKAEGRMSVIEIRMDPAQVTTRAVPA